MPAQPQLLFPPFRVDLLNERLWRDGREITVRPKTFAVLRYLLQRPGQSVSNAELLKAVWPDVVVSEAVPRMCISELRRALGDSVQNPRFIATQPGRGYHFVPLCTTIERLPQPASSRESQGAPDAPGTESFVGRATELEQLRACAERVRGGQRQIVFLAGEAGIGKTTLIEHFEMELRQRDEPLWIGRGQCVEHFGTAEAYLPVLEALGRFGRGPGSRDFISLLARHAPTWLTQLPGLVPPDDVEALRARTVGVTRERMLRELAEVLELLATEHPLVLVFEDLHWSDPSTLDLIAALARRRDRARLMVVATYRAPDVLLRRHPVPTLTHELQTHGHCVEIALTLLPEEAVLAYLTRRLPDLPVVDRVAGLVHRLTEGNPMFMVNLVDTWVTEGVLRAYDGDWAVPVESESLRESIPHSLQQTIEGQIDRLSVEEQQLLEAASATGAEFSAAAVAAALGAATDRIDDACASLARRRQLLCAIGEHIWPDGTAAGRYRFVHALYQSVLYGRVSTARRVLLHRRIAERQEAGYGGQVDTVAAELAVHFEKGRDHQRAVYYLQRAAAGAIGRCSYQEAIHYLTKGQELLMALPDTPERTQQELMIHVALCVPLVATQGYAGAEVEAVYRRARELCGVIGTTPELFPVLLGLCRFYSLRAELQVARELGDNVTALAEQMQDPMMLLEADRCLGWIALLRGEFTSAATRLERSVALCTPERSRALLFLHGQDPWVSALAWLAVAHWYAGYPDRAQQDLDRALRVAHEASHPMSLAAGLAWASILHQLRRESRQALEHAEAFLALARAQGFTAYMAYGSALRGWALAQHGHADEGVRELREAISAAETAGARHGRPYSLSLLAEAHGAAGQIADALSILTEALTRAHETGEGRHEAELHRLKGEFLLQESDAHRATIGRPTWAAAEACFQQARSLARRQGARSLELRAAVSLGRLWQRQGKRAEIESLVAPIHGWFTEGFATVDLKEAKTLLEEVR
jgi:predicted ATPase/DNA-binding winged helix-turn-helix (wHTH) protein